MPLDHLYSEPPPLVLMRGVIANTPADANAHLFVRIEPFAQPFGPCPWTPHGATLPVKGADCLVAQDETGLKWVVQWVGSWS